MLETKEYRPPVKINPTPKSPCVETVEYNPVQQTLSSPSSDLPDHKTEAHKTSANGVTAAQDQFPRRIGLPNYAQRLERLRRLADEAAREIPEKLLMHLHGGISMSDRSKLHKSSAPNKPLYILGEYCNSSSIGRHIILYGGSIDRIYGTLSDNALKKELDRIIKHELTHHWESLSGVRDLEIYDAEMIRKYKHGLDKDTETE